MVSFGIGVLGVTPVLVAIYFLLKRQWPKFHLKVALIPGIYWQLREEVLASNNLVV